MKKGFQQAAGNAARKTSKSREKKNGLAGKLFLALVTFCNLLLALMLAVFRRQEVIHAVQEDGEGIKVLLTAKKETKTPKGQKP